MNIERDSGKVTLPNGFSFDASLTEREFRNQGLHDPACVTNPGTPWFYYPLSGGELDGHDTRATLCFYGGKLVTFGFIVWLYPEDEGNWANFSYEKEAQYQTIYARLFRHWFGPPHKIREISFLAEQYPVLSQMLSWTFFWGDAWCGYDERSGTSAMLRYTKNDEWAHRDYQRHHPPQRWGIRR